MSDDCWLDIDTKTPRHRSLMTHGKLCVLQPQPTSPGKILSTRSHLSLRLVTHMMWPRPKWRNSRYA